MMFGWHDPMAMDLASVRTRRPKLRSTKTERIHSRSMDYKTCSGTPSALGARRLPGTLITLPYMRSRLAQRSLIVWPPSLTENVQPKDLPHALPHRDLILYSLNSQGSLVDTDASAHGRRQRHLAQVDTLARGRLGFVQRIDQGNQVALQIGVGERLAADRGVDDTRFVGTVLNLTGFGVFHRGGDVRGYGADLRVRHQAAWSQDLTQGTDDTHGVWRGDDDVERHVAGLDHFGQVFHTNDVGAGGFSLLGFFAGGENSDAHGLAGAGWQHDGTADDLVRLLRIDAQLYRHVDRFIELGGGQFFDQSDGVVEWVSLGAINFSFDCFNALGQFSHDYRPSTVMPIERAEPAMVRTAASMSAAVRSGVFVLAISSACARVSLPTLSVCGFGEPLVMPASFLIRKVAGGVFMTKVNDLSANAVITTGIGMPGSIPWVCALNALQNSMMFRPR